MKAQMAAPALLVIGLTVSAADAPAPGAAQTDALAFHLCTRVTEKTWPELRKFARPGDLFWRQKGVLN